MQRASADPRLTNSLLPLELSLQLTRPCRVRPIFWLRPKDGRTGQNHEAKRAANSLFVARLLCTGMTIRYFDPRPATTCICSFDSEIDGGFLWLCKFGSWIMEWLQLCCFVKSDEVENMDLWSYATEEALVYQTTQRHGWPRIFFWRPWRQHRRRLRPMSVPISPPSSSVIFPCERKGRREGQRVRRLKHSRVGGIHTYLVSLA